jgi:mannose-6-phosphate isomerase-like protein (cupin superfamily)
MKRIITENDANGRSRIAIEESDVPPLARIWSTSATNWLGDKNQGDSEVLDFQPGSTNVRYLELPTEEVMQEFLKRGVPGLNEKGFHRTGTIDYVIVTEGTLVLELDTGSVEVNAGDIVVQRDTNHAWRNYGTKPVKAIAITVAPPKGA